MKPADILALLPVKPEDTTKIATATNKPTRAEIKSFKEIVQDQAMSITTCEQNLGLLGMLLRESYFNPLNNGIPFATPKYAGPTPVNTICTSTQIN